MSKSTWNDVEVDFTVELGGREWVVEKFKRKGKSAKVTVTHKGRSAESVVKLKDRVKIVARKPGRAPLRDESGVTQRWATKAEHVESEKPARLPAGNASHTKPPEKAKGSPWDTQADRVERKLDEILGAHLVGIATDESSGYYVPPVDVTTIASHLALFHGGIPGACDDDESKMLAVHRAQHDNVKQGGRLAVNHWHTEKRPGVAA